MKHKMKKEQKYTNRIRGILAVLLTVSMGFGIPLLNFGYPVLGASEPKILASTSQESTSFFGEYAHPVRVNDLNEILGSVGVDPIDGLETSESGTVDHFSVTLSDRPTDTVTIALTSNDTGEGTVTPELITIRPQDWNDPVEVTVTGVDDHFVDGDQTFTVLTMPAVSDDPEFNGYDAADVQVINLDNDTAGIVVDPSSGLITSEAGDTAVFNLSLLTQPSGPVTLSLSSSNLAEGIVDLAQVTLLPEEWNVPIPVTVTGVDDDVDDGDQALSIITSPASSSDENYDNFNPDDVLVLNEDDDQAGVEITPSSGLVTSESGGADTFNIRLNSRPTGNVTISLSSNDETEGVVVPTSVTFTEQQWNQSQTITVTGVDDLEDDDDQAYLIMTAPAESADNSYNNLNPADVEVTNTDNDDAGILYMPQFGLVTSENGGSDTITISLGSRPRSDVQIQLSSTDSSEGVVSPGSLTFTAGDWNIPKSVVVTGIDDVIVDGDQSYSVNLTASSNDHHYDGLGPFLISALNQDNDTQVFIPFVLYKFMNPVLYFDPLNVDNGWQPVPESGASTYFTNGYYLIQHTVPGRNVRTVAPVDSDEIPSSYSVEVEASLASSGDPNSLYGVTFDWIDESRFYRFLVSPSEDKFLVYKFEGGWQLLAEGYAALGGGSNHLKIERNLDLIRVYANDMELPLAELSDTTYLNGRIGLTILASQSASVSHPALVWFNDFSLSQLTYTYKSTFTSPIDATAWMMATEANAQAFTVNGTLHLKHIVPNRNIRLVAPPPNTDIPERYSVTVDAEIVPGADTNTRFGLLFDWLDPLRTYRLLASPFEDKIYLQKFSASGWTAVGVGEWSVPLNNGLNTLRIERDGAEIRIYANQLETPIGVVHDSSFTSGQVGVIIVASPTLASYAETSFDNFTIKDLDFP